MVRILNLAGQPCRSQLEDGAVCFVGIGLPSEATNLARATHAPSCVLIYESGTTGAKPDVLLLAIGDGVLAEYADSVVSVPEIFNYWLQAGRVDVGFLGAAQMDRHGNINTTVIGPYESPKVRLPGAGGAPEIAASAKEVIIILRQKPRSFVEELAFVTSVGHRCGDSRRELGYGGVAVALLLVGFIFVRLSGENSPVLYNRDLLLIYIAAIAILWTLWFFGFWSVSIIGDAAQSSFLQAALTAAFNAGVGILGFPAGGWLADYAKRKGWGRKPMLVSFTLIQGLLTLAFGLYIIYGGQSLFVMGVLLFFQALFFFALQPMSHALTADFVNDPAYLGAAFGMWNLIGEIGAVLSPAISGVLRDTTGSWHTAVLLDAGIILASIVLLLFVRESRAASTEESSEIEATS